MTKYPPIQIVDEDDKPIRGGTLEEAHGSGLIHQIVIITIKDPDGNILLQKRSPNVATNPNRWDFAAAGHVDWGEDYLTAAKRELREEIGLQNVELVEVAYYRTQDNYEWHREWRELDRYKKIYQAIVPKNTTIVIEEAEVSETRWLSPEELHNELAQKPDEFTTSFQAVLDKVTEYEDNQH